MPENEGTEEMVTLKDARELFPGGISIQALRHRITKGIRGVKLKAMFDGHRYWTCQKWIDEYLHAMNPGVVEPRRIPYMTVEEALEIIAAI